MTENELRAALIEITTVYEMATQDFRPDIEIFEISASTPVQDLLFDRLDVTNVQLELEGRLAVDFGTSMAEFWRKGEDDRSITLGDLAKELFRFLGLNHG